MAIKQTIPNNMVESPLHYSHLSDAHIKYKQIITDWLWRNQHAQPIITTIIDKADYAKAEIIAKYYKRVFAVKVSQTTMPEYVISLYRARVARLPSKTSENSRHKLHLKINHMKREWPELQNLT